jgi:hypothetical protein
MSEWVRVPESGGFDERFVPELEAAARRCAGVAGVIEVPVWLRRSAFWFRDPLHADAFRRSEIVARASAGAAESSDL